MLLWTLIVATEVALLIYLVHKIKVLTPIWLSLSWIPIAVAVLSTPLSGWLADAKFGNFKVFRFGVVLLFLSTVSICLLLVIEALIRESKQTLDLIILGLFSSFFVVGASTCYATALPLGLDQMPDASSSNITSYIAWYVCIFFVGPLLGEIINKIGIHEETMQSYQLIWALLLAIGMCVVLSSFFLFSPKWLIIEPRSPQTLRYIYKVLKFAVKHKAPLNRSAFTYWEEDIPSRIDLGKTKYGGPFTTEQVEDVKTILRLIAIALPFFIIGLSFGFTFNVDFISIHLFFNYRTGLFVTGLLTTFVSEFFAYPFIGNKLPSILKRIGATSLILTLVSFAFFVLKLVHTFWHSSKTITEWMAVVLYYSMNGILGQVLLTSLLEFMSAQSPYNMRGLLLSSAMYFVISSFGLGSVIGQSSHHSLQSTCKQLWCSLVMISVKSVLCLIGFLLFCVVARWYKRRVRDDDYSTQQVVEEVYDRYLTAAAAHSKSYGAINS